MPLQSELLSGDAKLEAAAVSDPAHIMQGASGEHVKKIQAALIKLDGAKISIDGQYGPGTAAAVLAYKRKRNIVNLSYEKTADNVVGKMTMASLDQEMLALEAKPVILNPLHPAPRFTPPPRSIGPRLAFSIGGGPTAVPNILPVPPGPDVKTFEVIIVPDALGTFAVLLGAGGKAIRTQTEMFYGKASNQNQVATFFGSVNSRKTAREELEIKQDNVIVTYQALNCGETFMRVEFPGGKNQSSTIRLLSLVEKAHDMSLPPREDRSPDPNFPSGLMSKAGTPLNPLPGKSINLFGEGETPGFENYASFIDFCSHTFSNGNGPTGVTMGHRPWTADPRKPKPGIEGKTVKNICARSTPLNDISIAEIHRIAGGGCRFTYAQAAGRNLCDKIFPSLKNVKVIEPITLRDNKEGFGFIVEFQ